jgi:hypothetical protein
MTHRESQKKDKPESQKHSSPEIISNNEIEKHKSKGKIRGTE